MREFAFDEKTSRDAFGAAVHEAARIDDEIVAVGADTTFNMGLRGMWEEFPQRVINNGIAEQNMMNISAGLASMGFKVFAGSFAPFVTMRALEQFRTFIAYPNLDVKVAGGMGGYAGATEGVTHQALEDVAIMRSIPNTLVLVPADYCATKVMTRALAEVKGPGYIRLGKMMYRKVYDTYTFTIGKANLLEEGADLTIICNGTMVARSLQAFDLLKEQGVSARVLEMPCVKPLDEEAVLRAAEETGAIVVAEEASRIGGLGGAVAQYLGENRPTFVRQVAAPDEFGQSGPAEVLMDAYGLGVKDIVEAAKHVLAQKQ